MFLYWVTLKMKIGELEIDLNELSRFLVEAKKVTYANSKTKEGRILLDGSKQLCFEQGRFCYIDNYIGHFQFSGTETIKFHPNKHKKIWPTIWKMNYFGRINEKFRENDPLVEKTYEFLRQALSNVPPNTLFRGPNNFLSSDNNWRYSCFSDSGLQFITAFEGGESITLKDNRIIYSGNYHGGIIIPK